MLGTPHTATGHDFHVETRRPCGPGCELITSLCSCGFGRRLRVLDGKVVQVEVRLRTTWQWIDPRELLAALPYALCPECGGAGECLSCRGLGLMEIVPRHAGVAVVAP